MIPPLGPAARSRRAAVREREELVVARLQTLAPSLDGEPDPDFQARTRARLVAMAAVRQPGTEPEPSQSEPALERLPPLPTAPARWRRGLTSALAGAAVAVTAVAGVAGISADAGPGDALYGVKRGTEATQLGVASDSSRGTTLLDFASTRLAELQDLLRRGADPALVIQTLTMMDDQTRDGAAWQARLAVEQADDAPLERLAAWQDSQSQALLALHDQIPAAADGQYAGSLALLEEVGIRADALEASVLCPTGPATEGVDALGPVPLPCAPGAPGGTGGSGDSAGTGGAPQPPGAGSGEPSTGSGDGTGGVSPGDSGGGGTSGSGGTGGAGGGQPSGPDTPVESPELPTGQPLPTLPSVGGLPPGAESSPSSSASSSPGALLPCVPTLTVTC